MAKQFTQEEKELLSNTELSAKELCNIFNVKTDKTIGRWRKQLGIKVKVGSKKGKSRPFQCKSERYQCIVCNTIFEDIPSKKRKLCSKICLKIFNKSMDKSYMQTEEYKNTKRKPYTPEFLRYKREVHRLSQLVYEENIDTINPERLPRTVAGVAGGYQLDHIITVREGFDKKIPAVIISQASNLRMLPWEENLKRNRKRG